MSADFPGSRPDHGLIDDFSHPDGLSRLGTRWRLVTDTVMGGVSRGTMTHLDQNGRRAVCVEGEVRLENNGGFLQANLDLAAQGASAAVQGFAGVRLIVRGNGEVYSLHLKTSDTRLPWQAYRARFVAGSDWREVRLPFNAFEPHRLTAPLDLERLTRLGLVAIGRAFRARVCLAEIGWYRDPDDHPFISD